MKREPEKLKPCPFCGGEAEMEKTIQDLVVRCTAKDCRATVGGSWLRYEASAIAAWNRRPR